MSGGFENEGVAKNGEVFESSMGAEAVSSETTGVRVFDGIANDLCSCESLSDSSLSTTGTMRPLGV